MPNSNDNLDSHNKRNSLGINKQVYGHLLNKLESLGEKDPSQPIQRIYTRLQYHDPYFELTLDARDMSKRRSITVAVRNISRGGMSILHSNFIYPQTPINASLKRVDGSLCNVSGVITRCSHRGGVIHELGIQFDNQITVQEFIRPDINESMRSYENVDPEQLVGKIAFVGTDPSVTPFIREFLQPTGINYGFEDTAKDALEKDLSDCNLLFVSLDAGDMSGPEFARCVRDLGFRKPIILSGRALNDQMKQQIRLSSADMFLPIPITENTLLCALAEYLMISWTENSLETIRKGVDTKTITHLQDKLFDLATELDSQLEADDSVEVYITCSKIQSISAQLGMKSLYSLTFTVCEEIAQSGEIEKFDEELTNINKLCKAPNAKP